MDLTFLTNYISPITLGICLCIGFIIKYAIPSEKINRYIPVIVCIIGIVISVWAEGAFTPVVLLSGLVSGLSSTGAYEMFKNFIEKK